MPRPVTRNKAFLAAYDRGARDHRKGIKRERCPYKLKDARRRGGATWGAVYRRYWQQGWDDAARAPASTIPPIPPLVLSWDR